MSLLSLDSLTVRRGPCPVVDSVSLSIGPGECVGLVGPNGAGKTTLMRAALGLLPFSGASSLAAMPVAGRARAAAWLPQTREIAWPVSVEALVALGRLPHLPRGARLRPDDQQAVNAALSRMDLAHFRDRPATELSGGEQARALIARALAQETPLLIADEPTAGLDPAHQIAAMEVFRTLADEGRGVLVSLHDLGVAARYCHRLILMDKGRVVADGAPEAVLDARNLAGVFRLRARFTETEDGRMLQIIDRLG